MIVTREVAYNVDGQTTTAHLAHPDGVGPWPAVLIGHDGIGLEDYQRGRADLLAKHGYAALALDYHAGRTYFGQPQAMLDRVLPLLSDPARMQAIGRAGLDALLAVAGVDGERVAALGYGAGGRIVLELARTGAPLAAVAVVHPGLPEPRADDWTGVSAAFLLCTGSQDPLCTPAQLLDFGSVLQDAGADWRITVYGGAQHAFWAAPPHSSGANIDDGPTGTPEHAVATVPGVGYHGAHAARAWSAILTLFDDAL
ncbi:dienelactone hydrolase family protein [Mycolicibacterium sp. NCC-Tsukiji]|uniref:dienelactone hydrolase family protein n=1 Tax=Mycolicibacterium sp. NCC-Tsukiji TaxID=2185272 RepID=UPI000EC9ABB9|nr:dienelactone hydrolase family protein [Mycolicibacterium sp. NCC-Tsukiji]GCA97817.1 dienelactone hydrolase [Mycolicibacterium sp. NCC-Tsukiji]